MIEEYVIKSAERQAQDRADLQMYSRISRDMYFDQLQLLNKIEGCDTYEKVNGAERHFSYMREFSLHQNETILSGPHDLARFQKLHEFLFQDIYYFAGQLRDVPMEIDPSTRFMSPRLLQLQLPVYFDKLKSDKYLQGLDKGTFVSKLANYLTTLNLMHPFREGNGRTKREFFTSLANDAGWTIDWQAVSKDEWLMADECAFDSTRDGQRDTTYLQLLLDRAITPTSYNSAGNTASASFTDLSPKSISIDVME